jgi:replicative DNA helicase
MPLIDEKFGKPAAGELITIAARPGQGKSALGIMLAYAAAHYGHRTLIFSAEMSGEEIIDRIICIVGGKDAKYNDHKAIAEAKILGKLKNLHIFDDQSTHSISKIDAKARAMASLEGGIGCIMIDYLGLIEPEDKRQVREQQIANMTKALKRLASYCKCPIYLLCQLNRNVEANGKPRDPILSDLRESGAIEQDSNRVWFLCEDQEWLEQLPAGHLPAAIQNKWIQAKYRGGQANIGQKMLFDKPIFKLLPVIS